MYYLIIHFKHSNSQLRPQISLNYSIITLWRQLVDTRYSSCLMFLCLLFVCCVRFCLHFIDTHLHRSYINSIQPTATTAWEEALKQHWAPVLWKGLTVSIFQNQRSMPLVQSSCQRTALAHPLPCYVTSPLPTLPTKKASGWRMDRRSLIQGQSTGTQLTGDRQLRREDNADNKCSQWLKVQYVSIIYLNASCKIEVAMQAKSTAEVMLHSHISDSTEGI